MTDIHHNEGVLEADESYDTDSTYEGSINAASYTSSIASSVLNYKYENGRRYHAFHDGEYILPNDEQEQDRLDLSHHIYRMILDGELYSAPVRNPKRILDIGTGTGIWAIEIADEFPDAEVIGNDLSPIQPPWTPPNCRFEIDDFEQTWQYSRPFDYIHGRELEGSVRDYERLFRQALDNLVPGGYFEIASIEVTTTSDDGTHVKAENFVHLAESIQKCAEQFGKKLNVAKTWKDTMVKAGFENVEERVFRNPAHLAQLPPSLLVVVSQWIYTPVPLVPADLCRMPNDSVAPLTDCVCTVAGKVIFAAPAQTLRDPATMFLLLLPRPLALSLVAIYRLTRLIPQALTRVRTLLVHLSRETKGPWKKLPPGTFKQEGGHKEVFVRHGIPYSMCHALLRGFVGSSVTAEKN